MVVASLSSAEKIVCKETKSATLRHLFCAKKNLDKEAGFSIIQTIQKGEVGKQMNNKIHETPKERSYFLNWRWQKPNPPLSMGVLFYL